MSRFFINGREYPITIDSLAYSLYCYEIRIRNDINMINMWKSNFTLNVDFKLPVSLNSFYNYNRLYDYKTEKYYKDAEILFRNEKLDKIISNV